MSQHRSLRFHSVQIVAGLSLKNLQPRVWDLDSPYYLPNLQTVMVSYADFHRMPVQRRAAMEWGLREYLGVSEEMQIYLDNGAFYFLARGGDTPVEKYVEFVEQAEPDWYPIPRDYIPAPAMTENEQRTRFDQTMRVNYAYQHDGYAPVVHIGRLLDDYVARIQANKRLSGKHSIALGSIVPNLLRKPKAVPYQVVLDALVHVRRTFADKEVHVFGIGGTATCTWLACGVAVARGARLVAAAVHAGDHYVYPDCRPQFIEEFDAMQRHAVEGFGDPDLRLHAPFIHKTKAEIVEIGISLGVPYEDTWSCYEGGEIHCGLCGTCNERKEAFQLANVPDPTEYRE